MFVRCFSSYVDQIANLLSILRSSEHIQNAEDVVDMTGPCVDYIEESAQGTLLTSQRAKRELLEAFAVDVSQFSVVVVIEDESGIYISSLVLHSNYPK